LDLRCHCGGAADLPVGLFGGSPVQSHLQKYFHFSPTQINSISIAVSFPHEGRIAIVTDAERDAVDADGAKDESA